MRSLPYVVYVWSEKLSRDGFAHLGNVLSADEVRAARDYLRGCPLVTGYLPARPTKGTPFECYAMADVLAAPELLDVALRPDIVSVAREVLGCQPVIYSVNAFWTMPRHSGPVMTQVFHRDRDEEKFIALFLYLTDFTSENGASQYYVTGSHDAGTFDRLCATVGRELPRADYDSHKSLKAHMAYFKHFPVATLNGPAGTGVLMQPRGLHCGGAPRTPRLLTWFRYGTGENSAYKNDGIQPVSVAGRTPDAITRLVLK